jgi:hypothetical protein
MGGLGVFLRNEAEQRGGEVSESELFGQVSSSAELAADQTG